MLRFALILAAALWTSGATAQSTTPAKTLFGGQPAPADLSARAIGFYSRGCLAGAVAIPVDGSHWQAMRLSRNRNWGHPELIAFLGDLARHAAAKDGWPGLLIGDLSQPRGGPMLTGHASHQIGLDADIWLTPMPNRRLSAREREDMPPVPLTEPGPHEVNPAVWTSAHLRLIRRAASDPRVDRIFVAPGIKKKLCETETGARGWLRKVRPYYGHNYHMHVRLGCVAGASGCRDQAAPPPGDGCGKELAWWYTDEPYRPAKTPPAKPREITLADLPDACRSVLQAAARPGALTAQEALAAPALQSGRPRGAADPAPPRPQARPRSG
ncbi:penicillin-insensitive murein endopeptidase [Faunimonas sp. B44]|uniref:penicillin-insensitive murein endopeptidase n=1 Tax=Faunimonas sp. B44 TaxID=3461493 RepID=UPI0040448095